MFTITSIRPTLLRSRIQLCNDVSRITRACARQPIIFGIFLLVTGQHIQIMLAKRITIIQQSLQVVIRPTIRLFRVTIRTLCNCFFGKKVSILQHSRLTFCLIISKSNVSNTCKFQSFDNFIINLKDTRSFMAFHHILPTLIDRY